MHTRHFILRCAAVLLLAAPTVSTAATTLPLSAATRFADDRTTGQALFDEGDYAAALPYLQREAKAGNNESLVILAYLYRYGKGTKADAAIAMNLYNRGMERDVAECYLRAGEMYEKGEGVKKDGAKAFGLYTQAAEKGHTEAQWTLGECHREGRCGLTPDTAAAIAFYEKAAKAGYMYELLAMMYDSDALGPGRAADAFRWYTAYPTDRYTAAGRYRLAQLYAQGLGTQPDAEKALDILKTLDTPEAETLRDSLVQSLKKTAAEFEGGQAALMRYLGSHIKYPSVALENGVQGTVLVQFTVKADGITVYSSDGMIYVSGAEADTRADVYQMSGNLVYTGNVASMQSRTFATGLYIVRISGNAYKVIVK